MKNYFFELVIRTVLISTLSSKSSPNNYNHRSDYKFVSSLALLLFELVILETPLKTTFQNLALYLYT